MHPQAQDCLSEQTRASEEEAFKSRRIQVKDWSSMFSGLYHATYQMNCAPSQSKFPVAGGVRKSKA